MANLRDEVGEVGEVEVEIEIEIEIETEVVVAMCESDSGEVMFKLCPAGMHPAIMSLSRYMVYI